MIKISLIGLSIDEISEKISPFNEKKFRAKQIYEWIYLKNANSFDDMTNLSKEFREHLKENFSLRTLTIYEKADTGDAIKYLFKMQDGSFVESVLMPSNDRATICISSQVGCAVGCTFCATGDMGFKKQMTAGEIIEQVLMIRDEFEDRISNIVYMGMGEPFLNYDNVIKSAYFLNSEDAFGIGAKKITISTSGIVPRINQFAEDNHPFRLAISLNHTSQTKREEIMPITKKYPLDDLIKSAYYYTQLSGNQITFEYVMIKNMNMTKTDAENLKKLTKHLNCKFNLIPCNSTKPEFVRPNETEVEKFRNLIEKYKPSFIRKTRGRSIDAACGMLHNRILKSENIDGAI